MSKPRNIFESYADPKIANWGPKKQITTPKLSKNQKSELKGTQNIIVAETTWVDTKTVFESYRDLSNSSFGPQKD